MNALPRPIAITLQIVAALVAGIVLAVFAGPVLDNPSNAHGVGGSGGILPGAQHSECVSMVCLGDGRTITVPPTGNVGEFPTGQTGSGGSGGILAESQSDNAPTCAVCLGSGLSVSVGNVGEFPTGQTGSGGSGGILPGPADGSLLGGGTASGSVGNTN